MIYYDDDDISSGNTVVVSVCINKSFLCNVTAGFG